MLGEYQLAGIHKIINALTTHSELSHPVQQAMQLCNHRSQAGVNQLGAHLSGTAHPSGIAVGYAIALLARFLWTRHAIL